MRDLNGDLRQASLLHVESFCALDLNVIRARYWSAIPPPGKRREFGEVREKETHKTYQCRNWTKESEKCTELLYHTKQGWRIKCTPCFWAARMD